jgi:hypothetical protein
MSDFCRGCWWISDNIYKTAIICFREVNVSIPRHFHNHENISSWLFVVFRKNSNNYFSIIVWSRFLHVMFNKTNVFTNLFIRRIHKAYVELCGGYQIFPNRWLNKKHYFSKTNLNLLIKNSGNVQCFIYNTYLLLFLI